jgi:hypothetical protein
MKRILFVAAAALLACACHEIPQEAHKPFAAKAERELYDGSRFGGNKARFEKALAARARSQNEYFRMGDDKSP